MNLIKLKLDHIRSLGVNRKWNKNVMNLLLGKNVCGSCLCLDDDLVPWEVEFVLEIDDLNMERSLKNIMRSTFGSSIWDIVSTTKFCQKCIDVILKAYFLLQEIQDSYKHIQLKLLEISQQMKWTQHLDETGSLHENKNNKVSLDDTNNLDAKMSNPLVEQDKKTHKIILNNESLKTKLIQDPEMHKFLFKKDTSKEHKLPAGITVKKISKSTEMTDIIPHELLELNWADETDYDSVIPNTHVSRDKLHSNEALIMDLMEKAKTVENYTNFTKKLNHVETSKLNLNDSLTVKLIQRTGAINDFIDEPDLVPQDLLELKWPEEQCWSAKQCMKIPVKKLNFNDALTVKFIPSQNLISSHESIDEIVPHELLELNWNEESEKVDTDNSNLLETEQKHSIDLTKWLQDQGMSTIKIKTHNHENETPNMNDPELVSMNAKKIKLNPEVPIHINVPEPNKVNILETMTKTSDHFDTMVHKVDKLDANIDVKTKVVNEQDERQNIGDLRCALCYATFDQFETYIHHYKTHSITEAAKCYKCLTEFPVIELLSEHLLLMHSESLAYCNVCFAMMDTEKLAQHLSINHSKNVEIINILKEKAIEVAKVDKYCKKCKQPFNISSSQPHICVDNNTRCSECRQACIHEKYLSTYRNQLKKNKTSFKCTDCKYQYKTKYEIIKHANKVHLKHKPHRCKVCNVGFLLKASLGKHNNLYHARCDSCRRVFEDTSAMSRHRCKFATATDVKCELCGQNFSQQKYKQHKLSALAATDECVICQQTVPIKCNMVRHMEYIHNLCLKKSGDTILYECTICETDFVNEADFTQHKWVHTSVHECHVCAKRFSSKILFETHYQMHLATQCDLAKSFKCSVCAEQLIDKYAWAHHMQSHGDYEKCLICSKYIEKDSLSSHVESHEVLENKFQCPHCTLICNSYNRFEVHVNRFHLQTRPYQCDVCKKSFYSKHLVRAHIKHHNKREQCRFCGQKFARKCYLDLHIKRVHSTVTS